MMLVVHKVGLGLLHLVNMSNTSLTDIKISCDVLLSKQERSVLLIYYLLFIFNNDTSYPKFQIG